MPPMSRLFTLFAAMLALVLLAARAEACTVSAGSANLGSVSSYTVGTTSQQGSGSAGLQCDITLALLATHYVGLRVENSTLLLTGPGGLTIPYIPSATQNGAALPLNTFENISSTPLLSLFSGTGGTVPIYIRTTPTTALRAGDYTGSFDLRWYYSICTVGVVACITFDNSPGLVRPLLTAPTNWGTGVVARITVTLTVQNDCIINAPAAGFGSAPLVGSFNPITRTIQIRCSAGTSYTVGLDDGANASGTVRRMRYTSGSTSSYLNYEIYKTTSSTERWGSVGAARRGSGTAETNPGIYDSVTTQGYTYRAAILPGQVTPPGGTYTDTVRVDVAF